MKGPLLSKHASTLTGMLKEGLWHACRHWECGRQQRGCGGSPDLHGPHPPALCECPLPSSHPQGGGPTSRLPAHQGWSLQQQGRGRSVPVVHFVHAQNMLCKARGCRCPSDCLHVSLRMEEYALFMPRKCGAKLEDLTVFLVSWMSVSE